MGFDHGCNKLSTGYHAEKFRWLFKLEIQFHHIICHHLFHYLNGHKLEQNPLKSTITRAITCQLGYISNHSVVRPSTINCSQSPSKFWPCLQSIEHSQSPQFHPWTIPGAPPWTPRGPSTSGPSHLFQLIQLILQGGGVALHGPGLAEIGGILEKNTRTFF